MRNPGLSFYKLFYCFFLYVLTQTGTIFAETTQKNLTETHLSSIFSQKVELINLTEALILISKDWNPSIKQKPLQDEIDRLIESIKGQLKPEMTAQETVDILRQVIHHENGYRYTDQVDNQGIPTNPDELFLHGMLKSKYGYCMNLSLLYLIIGDRLKLPLHGVGLPNHFFVRYDSGSEKINIETTEFGTTYQDSFYENRFGLKFDPKTPFFTQNLNKKQTLGAYLSNIGMVYHKISRPQKAIFYLKAAAKINPLSIEAHNNLANIYSETRQQKLAIQQYQKALQADPNNVPTLFNLGQTYVELSKSGPAIETFLQVTQIKPSFTQAHRQLVKLYVKKEKYIGALLHLKQLIKANSNDISARISIGKIYTKLKNFKLAVKTLSEIKLRYPNNIEVIEALAEAFYKTENLDRSITEYRLLLELKPKYFPAYIQLGWVHYRKEEFRMATAWTRRGLKLGIKSPQLTTLASMNLGLYAWLNGDHSSAKNWYRNALKEGSNTILQGILDDLNETALLFPKHKEAVFFSGWVYMESGKKDKALPYLNRFLVLSPIGDLANEARALLDKKLPAKSSKNSDNTNSDSTLSRKTLKDMVLVPSGFSIMGSNDHGEDEAPEHKTYLDAYLIDRYEVSANDFANFLNEVNNVKGYYLDNKYGTLFYDGRFKPRKGFENHPINNVNWKGADKYCRWKGQRLPTEAEWEKAARGTDGKIYPWGNQPPSQKLARYNQVWTKVIKHHVMVPVNIFFEGVSSYGVHNMAGNVKEWVDDWFDREYYKDSANHINPKGQIGGEYKILKGGSWRDLKGFIYSSFRNNNYPGSRLDDYGFRCAKSTTDNNKTKQLTKLPLQILPQKKYGHYRIAGKQLRLERTMNK